MEAYEFLFYVAPLVILVYGASLLFIRPTRKILGMSLLGGLVLGIITMLFDIVAYQAHIWQYVFRQVSLDKSTALQSLLANTLIRLMDTLHAPLPLYITPVLLYGSLAFLLIWRFWTGRWRWLSRVLLLGTPLFCIGRSMLDVVLHNSLQVWEQVPLAIICTVVLWILAFYAGFALFWRVAAWQPYHDTGEEVLPWHPADQRPSPSRDIVS